MKVGFTYDAREHYLARGYSEEDVAEFDKMETVERIKAIVENEGMSIDDIGPAINLLSRLSDGDRWPLVFNLCEGLHSRSREAQAPAMLDMFRIPYTFSDPTILCLTHDKGLCKQFLRGVGCQTADFQVVTSLLEAEALEISGPSIVKPIAEGSSKGITEASYVENSTEARTAARGILDRYDQAVLVENYLGGREFTVGLLGSGSDAKVLGVMEIEVHDGSDSRLYSFKNKWEWEKYVRLSRPTDAAGGAAASLGLKVWQALGGRDAGRVDIRLDMNGVPNALEVNAIPGLHPVYSDLTIIADMNGISYERLISGIFKSACARAGLESRLHVDA